MLKVCRRCRNK